ncbi:Wyosine [tRNA(Phe)-imidazoG37] synthetase, radical SAM superfamily [Clostridium cochlearium]|uniref:Wyosine [tRNA(Phe)-imidazoG37] synthetase, radical SAM superfamily n=1 Tax=Clostridium cochlearium TaxID=1494 RepID=A0ABY0QML8_CLOCO|nr:radical SAM protein [Clostridium cochlearium]SDL28136.1 Wyosine [tRNA(Phe)-imidazoG37] synthetase, radical SAM superfamily [Clostridium cochlearium]
MDNFKYIYGPIPSRRLGLSLGVSPIPKKFCNYSCIYCQIGVTHNLTNTRREFFPLEDIINEFKRYISSDKNFDVVSIVGEGEPTLYNKLGELIISLKKLTDKPIAVITNTGLLYDKNVQEELLNADIVLPSMDFFSQESFKALHRPYGRLDFQKSYNGLVEFSKKFKGELWLEVMLIEDINSSKEDLLKLKELIKNINYSKIYINTAVRPPAESWVKPASKETIDFAVGLLDGISIDNLSDGNFISEIKDNYEAILSIIKRHPMNQHELKGFLLGRKLTNKEIENLFLRLKEDENIEILEYKGFHTYRLK